MSKYTQEIKEQAQQDLKRLLHSEPKSYYKALQLIGELYDSPRSGTGHPEPLRGRITEQWSRRITKNHRLVYEIRETEVVVLVLAAYGHYEDK